MTYTSYISSYISNPEVYITPQISCHLSIMYIHVATPQVGIYSWGLGQKRCSRTSHFAVLSAYKALSTHVPTDYDCKLKAYMYTATSQVSVVLCPLPMADVKYMYSVHKIRESSEHIHVHETCHIQLHVLTWTVSINDNCIKWKSNSMHTKCLSAGLLESSNMSYSMINFFLTIALSCIKGCSTTWLLIVDEEETGADMITIGTHPNVTRFLEIFGCDNYGVAGEGIMMGGD